MCCCLQIVFAHAQQRNTRILFLLDCSGSMNEKLGNKSRFETARNLLVNLVDSLSKNKSKVEIGIRAFGHQYPNKFHNCEDSKLEIPFAKNNAQKINNRLKQIHPQGYTPLAYSIFKAAEQDFPNANLNNEETLNAIVLITDGVETCDGDPCAAALLLQKKRISLKPFIIGLGLQDSFIKKFTCVGTYFDAKTEQGFRLILKSVVSQIMNTTTVQVNLINEKGEASETNVELTFADNYSHLLKYSFVHSLNDKGIADTLKLDPIGKYDVTIHTMPPILKTEIELDPGRHNIIAADAPQGNLQLTLLGNPTPMALSMPPKCVVRQVNKTDIVNVQEFGDINRYLSGEYDLEILCLPPVEFRGVMIKPSETKNINLPAAGTLSVFFEDAGLASIYTMEMNRWKKVFDWNQVNATTYELNLQPGEYDVVFYPNSRRQSDYTQTKHFKIQTGQVSRVSFRK